MDKLLQRQSGIQKKLVRQHLQSDHLVLYDITSVYFEGEYQSSELVKFGYNRDRKKGREQVVAGLICNDQGCPVGVEVYAGNPKDETTVMDKIHEIKSTPSLFMYVSLLSAMAHGATSSSFIQRGWKR